MIIRAALVALTLLLAAAGPTQAGGGAAQVLPPRLSAARAEQRLLAGHLLRRIGFGPDRREMHEVLRLGRAAYLEQQLHPDTVDDRLGERRFHPQPGPDDSGEEWQLRWLTRMTYSRRQLQEKMALLWHEHFATSYGKVGSYALMRDQERLFRAGALGSFRDLLVSISTDNAMLIYLDNTYNNGQAYDENGDKIPPNENYARELLQLFGLGVNALNLDGSLVLDERGRPVPAYTEADVKEVARALTGWIAHYPEDTDEEDPSAVIAPAEFADWAHDPDAKVVLGEVIPADSESGARDVERVADIIMAQPTTAPFISKILIQKLATETPSRGYVQRVATVFATSRGDLRAVVSAIVSDAEFTSPAVVRAEFKTPIEHFVGALRGLGARGGANSLYFWTSVTGHLVYFPPSVFSFYRPGQKGALLTAAGVALRDQATDSIVTGLADRGFDAVWDAPGMLRRYRLAHRPAVAVDLLARELLAAPLTAATRQVLLDYVGPQVSEAKLRGAAWLLMCAPEYQVN